MKGKKLLLVDKPDASQTYFAIGNVGTRENDPDRVAIRVVNTIFGGRFTSELNEALRVESGSRMARNRFLIREKRRARSGFTVLRRMRRRCRRSIWRCRCCRNCTSTVSQRSNWPRRRATSKGNFRRRIETSEATGADIATYEFYGLGDNEINELEARVDAMTPEMAKQVIAKHFPADNLVFMIIGKASEIGPALRRNMRISRIPGRLAMPGFWPPGPSSAAK